MHFLFLYDIKYIKIKGSNKINDQIIKNPIKLNENLKIIISNNKTELP